MSWPPELSSHLRRRKTEPAGLDCADQSDSFILLCFEAGFDDDQIIMLAREHEPTKTQLTGQYDDVLNDRQLTRRIEKLRPSEVPEIGSAKFIDWLAAFDAAPTQTTYCLPGLVPQGHNVALVGEAKLGKSLLVLDACAAKAAGKRFLGCDSEAGPILYLDWENRPDLITQRLRMMDYQPEDLEDLHYQCFPALAGLDTAQGAAEVLRRVKSIEAQLVVLDTVQRAITGEEQHSTGIRAMYQRVIMPLREQGVAVLRLDHLGKNPGMGARGSSAKLDDVDDQWLLQRSQGGLALRRTHSRAGQGPDSFLIQRTSDPLGHALLGEGERLGPGKDPVSGPVPNSGSTTEDLGRILDKLGVPMDAGRPTAAKALKDAGHPFKTEVLAEVVKARRSSP